SKRLAIFWNWRQLAFQAAIAAGVFCLSDPMHRMNFGDLFNVDDRWDAAVKVKKLDELWHSRIPFVGGFQRASKVRLAGVDNGHWLPAKERRQIADDNSSGA